MTLTLADVAEHPEAFTTHLQHPAGAVTLRPLEPQDDLRLARFLEALSPQTRVYWICPSYDLAMAQELCAAINRYDKLRFVVTAADDRVIALLEFSFGIPAGDHERYRRYGVALAEATDCRFGPCIADNWQNRGLGSMLFPYMVDIARRFGKQRMILWGGVMRDNLRAIRYYEKQGFVRLGTFQQGGEAIVDMLLDLEKIATPEVPGPWT